MLPTHSPRMTKCLKFCINRKNQSKPWISYDSTNVYFFQRRKTPEPTTSSKPNQSFRVFLGNPCQQNYPRVNTLLFNLAEFAKTLDGTWFVYNNKMFRFAEKESHRNNNKTQISTTFREVSPKKSHRWICCLYIWQTSQKTQKQLIKRESSTTAEMSTLQWRKNPETTKKQKKPEMLSTLRKYFRSFFHRWRDCC